MTYYCEFGLIISIGLILLLKKLIIMEGIIMKTNTNIVAKLQELMIKALDEGDFDTYDKLEERLNRLNKYGQTTETKPESVTELKAENKQLKTKLNNTTTKEPKRNNLDRLLEAIENGQIRI